MLNDTLNDLTPGERKWRLLERYWQIEKEMERIKKELITLRNIQANEKHSLRP